MVQLYGSFDQMQRVRFTKTQKTLTKIRRHHFVWAINTKRSHCQQPCHTLQRPRLKPCCRVPLSPAQAAEDVYSERVSHIALYWGSGKDTHFVPRMALTVSLVPPGVLRLLSQDQWLALQLSAAYLRLVRPLCHQSPISNFGHQAVCGQAMALSPSPRDSLRVCIHAIESLDVRVATNFVKMTKRKNVARNIFSNFDSSCAVRAVLSLLSFNSTWTPVWDCVHP